MDNLYELSCRGLVIVLYDCQKKHGSLGRSKKGLKDLGRTKHVQWMLVWLIGLMPMVSVSTGVAAATAAETTPATAAVATQADSQHRPNDASFSKPFSNLIIFGDSLSDIGNFPSSVTIDDPETQQLAQNLYVPISNPAVIPASRRYWVPTHAITQPYPDITLNSSWLPAQPLLKGQPRAHRSLNWSQLFLALYDPKQRLWPWVMLAKPHDSLHDSSTHDRTKDQQTGHAERQRPFSVDYAWVAALTDPGCSNYHYVRFKDQSKCHREGILAAQQAYRDGQARGVKVTHVQVPGVLTQVALFQQDLTLKRVHVDKNTLYIVFIGANDLARGFFGFTSFNPKRMLHAVQSITGGSTKNIRRALTELIAPKSVNTDVQHVGSAKDKTPAKLDPDHGAKQILVINIYNLGLSPKVYASRFKYWSGRLLAEYFNHQLKSVVQKLQRQYPSVHIQLFDLFAVIDHYANDPFFVKSLGLKCDEDPSYLTPAANPNNCGIDKKPGTSEQFKSGYLFWNNSHPSLQTQQVIAYALHHALDRYTKTLH